MKKPSSEEAVSYTHIDVYKRQVLTLTLYADLSIKDVDNICDIILEKQ